MTKLTDVQIARVTHEANRAYCCSLGDHTQPSWDAAPDWQKDSATAGVAFIRACPDATPRESHEAWLREKRKDGWSYGPVKDPSRKLHPCFVPYDELPVDQRRKDSLFSSIVKALLLEE